MNLKKMVKWLPVVVILSAFFSCQSLMRLYLGAPAKAEVEWENTERLAYYKSFVDGATWNSLRIQHLRDSATVMDFFANRHSFPLVFVQKRATDTVYRLDCYDDVDWDVENLNKGIMPYPYQETDTTFIGIKYFIDNRATLSLEEKAIDSLLNPEPKWNLYLVYGWYLGKRMKRKSLPITNIKGIGHFEILDLTIAPRTQED